MARLRDPKTGKLLPTPAQDRKAKAPKAPKPKRTAREKRDEMLASRELAAMVGELLPADYQGAVPAGADLTRVEKRHQLGREELRDQHRGARRRTAGHCNCAGSQGSIGR